MSSSIQGGGAAYRLVGDDREDGTPVLVEENRRNPLAQKSVVVKMDIWPVAMRVCRRIGMRPRLRRRPVPIHFSMLTSWVRVEVPCGRCRSWNAPLCEVLVPCRIQNRAAL